jgi:hypothetical protein
LPLRGLAKLLMLSSLEADFFPLNARRGSTVRDEESRVQACASSAKDVDRLTVSANRHVLIHRFDSLRQFSDKLFAVQGSGQILASGIPNRERFLFAKE